MISTNLSSNVIQRKIINKISNNKILNSSNQSLLKKRINNFIEIKINKKDIFFEEIEKRKVSKY
jgi:hypothetical protein